MYLQGLGATQDYKAVFKLLKRADDQGYAPAQYNLGFIYENGKGVTQTYKTAIKFYTKAAEQGSARAQFNLGMMYYKGQGLAQDYIRANMWWIIAASQGNEDAIRGRDIIEEQMIPAQVEKALDLALECHEKNYKDC